MGPSVSSRFRRDSVESLDRWVWRVARGDARKMACSLTDDTREVGL